MKDSSKKPIIVAILGQTSTGKSDLAVEVSKLLIRNGIKAEIISADSRQVYKGLNLGTGKITKKEMKGIPHHLLDITNPKKRFTVANYKKLADKKIDEIIARSNIPIICGGSGFYIDTLINGTIFPDVPPNEKLRKKLNLLSVEALFKMLKKLDVNRAKNIDKKNKVRLIRAIEIAKVLGKVPSLQYATNSAMAKNVTSYKYIKIGLNLPSDILKEKIYTRLLSRIDTGMIREIKNLHKKGLSWKRMEELGLEYRYVSLYLQKKLTKKLMLEKLNKEICKFAKRQATWFKRDQNIKWFDAQDKNLLNKVYNQIFIK
ncbi:MAG: tRNA (adenosine(37)-N6)-dimethylallyltransferase MiaA [Candidatus Paceibacterota bacterium]